MNKLQNRLQKLLDKIDILKEIMKLQFDQTGRVDADIVQEFGQACNEYYRIGGELR